MQFSAILNNITIFCASLSFGGHVYSLNRPPRSAEQSKKNCESERNTIKSINCTFLRSDISYYINLQISIAKSYLFYRCKSIHVEKCASNLISILNFVLSRQFCDRYHAFHLISETLASPIFFFTNLLTKKHII